MERSHLYEQAKQIAKSPMAFFVRNGHMTILLFIGLVLGGFYSLSALPIESDPEVKIPIGTVVTVYPGASPSDVEKLITDKLEEKLKNLDDLKTLTSSSLEGASSIVVEFDASADLDDSIRKLRDEVESAKPDLPEEANDPIVTQIRAGDRPIVTFALVGNAPLEELKVHAEDLEQILEGIKGVNKVEVLGLPEKEMQVLVNIQKLEGLGLSITQISQAIAANHLDFPVGSIRTNELYYQASLKGQFDSQEELTKLVITNKDGRNIFLKDVAEIREVFAEAKSESYVYITEKGEQERTVSIDIYKKVGSDLVKIVDEAKKEVEIFKETLPSSLSIIITEDVSDFIRDDISRLSKSALQTTGIIAVILFIALGLKEAIAAALSIPILYLITFITLLLIGETFNFLTFFALILSLGIAIDTSIVIIEGIHDNTRNHLLDSKNAALASVATFRSPLISGTLTTIAAFLPLSLMTGIMGEYVKHIPITVNITLIASLATALMILPAIAAKILKTEEVVQHKTSIMDRHIGPFRQWYLGNIKSILASKKKRRTWVGGMIIAFIIAMSLPFVGLVKVQMFRPVDFDYLYVDIKAAEGSTLEALRPSVEKVQKIIDELPEVQHYITILGRGSTNKAFINIRFTNSDDRDISSIDISKQLREKVRTITDAEVTLTEAQGGPPTGSPIEARLIGDDVLELEKAASILQQELESIEGTKDIFNDLESSPGEFHISLKRDRLEYFGVTALQVAQTLRTSVFGNDSIKILRAGEETPILVKLDYRDISCMNNTLVTLQEAKENMTICRINPQSISEIQNLLIPTIRGQVSVSELIDVSLQPAVTTIRHYNTDRVVSVKGNVLENYVPSDVISELQNRIPSLDLGESIRVEFGGETEDINESFNTLGRSAIIAIILIAAILVFQFASFKRVFIILFTIPLAMIGVLGGLAILRFPLSFPGLIGLAALTGIVVNDAIVLIDRININRELGLELTEAVVKGCEQRLEPVILTTLSTAGGMVPLIFGGRMFVDLALVVALGITFATILTLVMVPVFYVGLECTKKYPCFLIRIKNRVRRN
ncbi:efflux RND transporter permease subunit [Patescibacteria group bacterium]|nr:efflux RND transporter permease subunit [Patescibacteria group bacterium]